MHAHTHGSHPTAARLAKLEAILESSQQRVAKLEQENKTLRSAYDALLLDMKLLKHRIFMAKAERVDTRQLELEFAEKQRALEEAAGTLGMGKPGSESSSESDSDDGESRPRKKRPAGRRDVKLALLPEVRHEVSAPDLEALVDAGTAKRVGFEESSKLGYKRGGMVRVVVARVKYQLVGATGDTAIEVADAPKTLLPRSLAAPSLLAHLVVARHNDGLPLNRIEEILRREGAGVDRGTMCRWLESLGTSLGPLVEAMRREALATAFCISTDATGIRVQPKKQATPSRRERRACKRGHYFVLIADRASVLYVYTEKETSAAVREMLRGYGGYVQADAKSVYDILYRPSPEPEDDGRVCTEVGCWSHARRRFWEALIAGTRDAREGLARISRIFELDRSWAHAPPADIKKRRDHFLRPHVQAFFEWVDSLWGDGKLERGLLRSALGYAHRNKDALMRFLDDGRLAMTNNHAERNLRRVATTRNAALFIGSDDHGVSASRLMSLVASAKLHGLDPEAYLRDLIRVLPHWPEDRILELAPRSWLQTRARLDAVELEWELGELTVPPMAEPVSPQE